MTEAEWLAGVQPWPMLEHLGGAAGERKLRLCAVACARRLWHLLADGPGRQAVEVAERHADGAADDQELAAAALAARTALEAWYRARPGTPGLVFVEHVAFAGAYTAAA